ISYIDLRFTNLKYSCVNGSTSKMESLHPHSIELLLIQAREAMERSLSAGPFDSKDRYFPPSSPPVPMKCETMSRAKTPFLNWPVRLTLIDSGTFTQSLPEAHTPAISELPIPVANAPTAPP